MNVIDIVVPTYLGHLEFLKKFLDTFDINCLDKMDVTINLIVSREEEEIFRNILNDYPTLTIKIMVMRDLVEKYDNEIIDENELLSRIGRFNYQSLKKLFGSLETGNEFVCLFDSECLFVRQFKMREYIDNNKNTYFYCSKIEHNHACDSTHAKYMQNTMNALLSVVDSKWYLESYMWVLRTRVLNDLKNFLIEKYHKLTQISKDFFIEYGYYLYYMIHQNEYEKVVWIDTNKVLKTYMPTEQFNVWYNETHPWCMLEHIGLHLKSANYEQLESVNYAYKQLSFPLFRLLEHNVMNQNMLLTCDNIKICVSEYCSDVYQLTMNNAFNKKIGVFVTGLFRECDKLEHLFNFIYPLELPIHYYITSNVPGMYIPLHKHYLTNTIKIDDYCPSFDKTRAKSHYNLQNYIVPNTISMFYKKAQMLKYADQYDVIINIRPDLLSFNMHLVDIIRQVLFNWDENTIYIPKIYNSVGITDTFAIGSTTVMKKYLGLYENINELMDMNPFIPEFLLYKHINNSNIKLESIEWDYKINHHPHNILNAWWRIDAKEIDRHMFSDYITLKSNSYETIEKEFVNTTNKFTITHVNTNNRLFITDPRASNSLCVSSKNFSLFNIATPNDITIRINIKYAGSNENLNSDGTGWNIFTMPDTNNVCGFGNNGDWAQFYLIKENDYYYIASFHSINRKNKCGTFGRYLGVCDNNLVSDLPKCDDARWFIR